MMGAWVFNGIIQAAVWPGMFKIFSTQLSPKHRARALYYAGTALTLLNTILVVVGACNVFIAKTVYPKLVKNE